MNRQLMLGLAATLALCAGCERVGDALDRARPADRGLPQPTAIEPPPALPVGPPPDRIDEPEILFSLEAWDAAPRELKEVAAEHVAARFPWITYDGLETFSSGGQKRDVAIFTHTKAQMGFALIPAGSFQMGSKSHEEGRSSDEVRRRVRLTRPFLMCRTECTQAGWMNIRTRNPSEFQSLANPVETVTMIDVGRFLARAKLELPTEAQWEYACRAGTTGAYSFGKDNAKLDEHAWYEANSGGKHHPAAQKKPNAFGLYDMHGNVLEWCKDRYAIPAEGDDTDPEGPSTASDQVVRGGSFQNASFTQRSAFRLRTHPGDKHGGIGFRPIKVITDPN